MNKESKVMLVDGPHGKLRKHQTQALRVAHEIVIGKRPQKRVVASVTPGGGKTLMASLFANALADGKVIDRVIVVVPNNPLRTQMLEGFHDPARGLDRTLQSPGAQQTIVGTGRPFGKVVTYQRLTSPRSAKKLARWCSEARTLVVFDEVHHLREHAAWEVGASLVEQACARVLAMSGTLHRHDEERIPMVNYHPETSRALIDILYTRADALEEHAVLPIEFEFFNGRAEYEHKFVSHAVELATAPTREQARALKTALLSAEYPEQFLAAALGEWELYRQTKNYPSSAAIVVCHSKLAARRAHKMIQHRFTKYGAGLSLSAEPQADGVIKKFRTGDCKILVTVKKAYEGLDVPNATHLIYLGDVRSTPFLDQVIARVTRFNRVSDLSWGEQCAFVYVPHDRAMKEYVGNMLSEQAVYFSEKERGIGSFAERSRSTFVPGDAAVTEEGFGVDGRVFTHEQNVGIRRLREEFPSLRATMTEKLELATRLGLVPLAPGQADAAE